MAPQCAPTEWVGRAGRWAELLHLHTDEGQGQTTWTHTTHFLAPSPDDNGYNLWEDRLCQPTSSKGWMRTRVLGYSPPINKSLWGWDWPIKGSRLEGGACQRKAVPVKRQKPRIY